MARSPGFTGHSQEDDEQGSRSGVDQRACEDWKKSRRSRNTPETAQIRFRHQNPETIADSNPGLDTNRPRGEQMGRLMDEGGQKVDPEKKASEESHMSSKDQGTTIRDQVRQADKDDDCNSY